jgi:hypothetical protein
MLPTVKLGQHDITRLIIGGNPFSGNSHQSPELDNAMEDFFTTEKIKQTLFRCDECGINAMQLRADKHIFRIMREYRKEGGQMHWIAQTAPEIYPFENNIRQIMKNDPIAIYHHGTVTDALFKAGNYDEIKRRLNIMRETGVPVGLGTHMPEIIEYAEENNWDIDWYMACVHNISKIDRVSSSVTGKMNESEPFDDEDRFIMYKTIRSVDKPCLAFKILGAGRKCQTSETVRAAYEEAFANIKPTDAIIVGMYPKDKDQIKENADMIKDILTK